MAGQFDILLDDSGRSPKRMASSLSAGIFHLHPVDRIAELPRGLVHHRHRYILLHFFQEFSVILSISVLGYTLGIPDSAMGITFLAAGGSVPEGVAAVVVARAGIN